MLEASGCKGIYISEDAPKLLQLLFADDMVNAADTVLNLQRQILVLGQFCDKYGMKVNMDNTKVVVFRRGGIVTRHDKWYYTGEHIECVSFYTFLGLVYSCVMSWSKGKLTLAQQATKAAKVLLHFVRKSEASCQQALFLFDGMISPILCYNSEIWGYEYCDEIERVHVKF
jgi:hypothetical protein